jgi:hypothetical protein
VCGVLWLPHLRPTLLVSRSCARWQTLTDIREIEQKLAEVIELERRADEELERQRTVIAAGRGGVDTEVLSLVAELEHIAPAIRSVASSTVSEAESVIARTRALDSAHSRVQKVRVARQPCPPLRSVSRLLDCSSARLLVCICVLSATSRGVSLLECCG